MKKYINSFLSISLIFVCLLFNPTFAKYTADLQGLAWFTNFSGFSTIGDMFVVEEEDVKDENGTIMDEVRGPHAWGAGEDDSGHIIGDLGGAHTMGKLNDVEFSVYNDSSQRLAVKFELDFYVVDLVTKFNFFVVNTSIHEDYVNPTTNLDNHTAQESVYGAFVRTYESSGWLDDGVELNIVDEGVEGSMVDGKYIAAVYNGGHRVSENIWFIPIKYTKYIGIIDPHIQLGDSDLYQEEYVIEPGEYFNYHLRCNYAQSLSGSDSVNSSYSTVRLLLEPYNG